jgi:hypothetical protein
MAKGSEDPLLAWLVEVLEGDPEGFQAKVFKGK